MDAARIDAQGPNEIEGAWIAPAVDMREQARGEERFEHDDGGVVVELTQGAMFVFDAKSLVCRAITDHETIVAWPPDQVGLARSRSRDERWSRYVVDRGGWFGAGDQIRGAAGVHFAIAVDDVGDGAQRARLLARIGERPVTRDPVTYRARVMNGLPLAVSRVRPESGRASETGRDARQRLRRR